MNHGTGVHITRVAGRLGLALCACLALAGCIAKEDRAVMAANDSVLAPLFKQFSPADAAAWAADPYDADKQARGMNMLANAPFGGAEAYTRLYRERLTERPDPENPKKMVQYAAPVRAVACRALALHGNSTDVPAIARQTTADEVQLRLEATRALQRLHNREAVPALLQRLSQDKEPEPEIRGEAASALGQYAEGSVLQALIAALADSSLLVNHNAHESLVTLTGNDRLGTDRKDWVEWTKKTDKPFADRKPYVYPVFWREKRWLDYVPFMPSVPNETASTPVGFSLEQQTADKK